MSKMVNEKVYNKFIVNVIGAWSRLSKSRRTVEKPFAEFAEYAGLKNKMNDFTRGVRTSQKSLKTKLRNTDCSYEILVTNGFYFQRK